jgi:hypothetical protein
MTSYLALQDFFIRRCRPVPSFLILDQPSQAFFPADRESGGDLDELSDTDRENTRRLYRLIHDVITSLDGKLQVMLWITRTSMTIGSLMPCSTAGATGRR